MNVLSIDISNIRVRIFITAVISFLFICGILLWGLWNKEKNIDDFTCKADLIIKKNNLTFKGVMDFKTGEGKGIVNVSGIVESADVEYTVQRTVLFTQYFYGVSPVWTSEKIITEQTENIPNDILTSIIPYFYIKPQEVTDTDIIEINDEALLMTKSSTPYMYCIKYNLYK